MEQAHLQQDKDVLRRTEFLVLKFIVSSLEYLATALCHYFRCLNGMRFYRKVMSCLDARIGELRFAPVDADSRNAFCITNFCRKWDVK